MTNKSLVLGAALAAVFTSSAAMAELTANVSATTNYLWRGVTQTGDASAVSGGIDYSDDSGAYAGVWVSNISGAQEVDYYGGYATDMFDVGVITYQYPIDTSLNFTELYVSGTFEMVTASAYFTIDKAGDPPNDADTYVSVSADLDPVSVWVGTYMFDADGVGGAELDYVHYGVSYAYEDFTFAVEKNDIEETNAAFASGNSDAYRMLVTWSKEWTL